MITSSHSIWEVFNNFNNYRIPFRYLDYGKYPLLELTCKVEDKKFNLIAVIDTGAQTSVFNGYHLGNKLLSSRKRLMVSNIPGSNLETYLHQSELSFPQYSWLPFLEMEIGFSELPIPHNLLGRDFLDKFLLIFAEHWEEFYLINAG